MKMKLSFGFLLLCLSLSIFAQSSLRTNKDYALFFAVKDYNEWGDLRNPISDAEAVAGELEREYGFKTEIIRNPNRNTIYDVLERYQKKTFPDDAQLFIFFSGHGQFIDSRSQGFFIPKDGKGQDRYTDSYVPLNTIKNMVNNIGCNHILLAIDACYSGTINEGVALERGTIGKRPGDGNETLQHTYIRKTLQHKTRLYLTSGGKERTPDGDRYSPFTEYLLKGLRDYRSKLITFWDLLAQLKRAEPEPHYGDFGHHEPGGNFLFISSNNAPINISSATPNEPAISQDPDEMAWQFARNLNTKDSYDYYLKLYPQGKYQREANQTINALSNSNATTASLPRDPSGKTYKTVELNRKTWLAENLAYDVGEGSWCYDEKQENCQEYGRLYTWEAAQKACLALGQGWRLPKDKEWREMAKEYGGADDDAKDEGKAAYDELKKRGDRSFSAHLGGYRTPSNSFYRLNSDGYYWSSTEKDVEYAWGYNFFSGNLKRHANYKPYGQSCRCIKE